VSTTRENGILIVMPTHKLTPEIINAAIVGFEQQKLRIDDQIAELRAMLAGGRTEPVATPEVPKGKRRKMSAAARKRMGDAQLKRWADSKGQAESPSETVAAKPKRKLSAAGKAAIVAALKKRWASVKAAAVKAGPVVAKKAAAEKAPAKKTAAKKAAKALVQPTA
jgi:hypothetical protein